MEKKEKQFQNSLEEFFRRNQTADPCALVIFGATGDLTGRKLVPALYNLARENSLPPEFVCVGFARREKTDENFREEMRQAVKEHSRVKPIDMKVWDQFGQQIYYHVSDFDNDEGYQALKKRLDFFDLTKGTSGNRVYYLATQPKYFSTVIEKLGQHGLLYNEKKSDGPWSRVIIEKPFGENLVTAKELQQDITRFLDEKQIYRIDHYLGKETVQNLLVLRFANPVYEAIWNNRYIEQVQITVAEAQGIGTRGHFFEEAGILRDIIQNHLIQLLTLVAMDAPSALRAEDIRNEKVKVLHSIRPFPEEGLERFAVRGQYGPGIVDGKKVLGYRQEKDVAPSSIVETYAAFRLYIDSWRWAGVPFYVRAGKRLPKRVSEIAITFKNPPLNLFTHHGHSPNSNTIVIRIQPDEGISLKMNCKVPGLASTIHPVNMNFRYGTTFGDAPPEAYERLICDCITGDGTLFAREDEVLASWTLFDPILESWKQQPEGGFPNYASGLWGPKEADNLLAQNGHKWRLP